MKIYREFNMDVSKLQILRGSPESLEHKLFLAINNGDVKGVQFLLKQGANVNSTTLFGKTALGAACYAGKVEIVKILLYSSLPYFCGGSRNDLSNISTFRRDPIQSISKGLITNEEWKTKQSVYILNRSQLKERNLASIDKRDTSSEDEELNGLSIETDFQLHCGLERLDAPSIKTPEFHDEQLISRRKIYGRKSSLSDPFKTDGGCCSLMEKDGASLKQISNAESNQGYYIVVHDEDDKESDDLEKRNSDVNSNEPQTPDGMDNLEWDSDFQEKCESDSEENPGSDSWVDLYRWYADYLAKSCTFDMSTEHFNPPQVDINQQDVYHWTAMHYAAEQGHLEIMRLLISAGCQVDVGDSDDVTPLHLAAARDYPEAVALLISCGATVNRRSLDRTGPLHMAAARGFMETARVLLMHGASVNALDRSDRTPLMLAAARGLYEMVDLLISHGAKVNMEDIHGYTALCQAVWQRDKRLVHLLLSAGAKLTHSDRLLHYAILHRCTEVAKLLIDAGSVVNLRDDCGDTPLLIAARTGQVEMASLLLRNGAVVNYPNGITGSVPLHEAVESLRAAQIMELRELLTLFLSCGAKLNPKSSVEDTPLNRAYRYGNDHALILLIQYGADVSILQMQNEIVSKWYLEKRPEHFIIAQLMIYAGLNLWKCADTLKPDIMYPKDSPLSWVVKHKFSPLSLTDLSRLRIRYHFGEYLYRVPSITSWPSRLRKIIMLEDVICIHE